MHAHPISAVLLSGALLLLGACAATGPKAAPPAEAAAAPAEPENHAKKKNDRHVGYYYPEPAAVEVYKARARALPDFDRAKRIGFVVAVVNGQLKRPYPPVAAFFVKGDEAEKLIIISNLEGRLNTIYRARALLATLTSTARTTPIFRAYKVEDYFTFLDLLKLMGFTQVTVSDGADFSHQILLQ